MSIQFIVNDLGDPTSVVVPIEEWQELVAKLQQAEPERNDTEYLLGSPEMKRRLMESLGRAGGKSWDEVRNALGI